MDKQVFMDRLNSARNRLTETDSAVTPQININKDETFILYRGILN